MDRLIRSFLRSLRVWQRNARVWQRSAGRSLLGCFADPLLYLLALGYGLGQFIDQVGGARYIEFLCSGIIAISAMNTATFEGLYLAYTRMAVQKTWDGMLAAPITVAEVVVGEILWMASKSVISASAILLVSTMLGLVHTWQALWVIPVSFLGGLCFGSMALSMTSLSHSYDFFMYYMTLVITPMILLSGVFFPVDSLPEGVHLLTLALPLHHLVEAIRSLMLEGGEITQIWPNLLLPMVFFLACAGFSVWRIRLRLLA